MDHLTITEVHPEPPEGAGRPDLPHDSDCAMRFHNSSECTCGKDDRPITEEDEDQASACRVLDNMDRIMKGQPVTIDITPDGLKTLEGAKRVAQTQKEWDDATHHLANELRECIDAVFDRDTNKLYKAELYSQLQTLIGIRDRKQEAFLRAVAGK